MLDDLGNMADYLFLLDKLDDVKQVTSFDLFKSCYDALDDIRKGEDFLFFKMNETLDDELRYYDKNLKELDEIILILDSEYAISAYHNVLKTIIDTKNAIEMGVNTEYFMLTETHTQMIDGKKITDKLIAHYTLPAGTVGKLLDMKNESKKIKDGENMYI